jgi:hypothetical protein
MVRAGKFKSPTVSNTNELASPAGSCPAAALAPDTHSLEMSALLRWHEVIGSALLAVDWLLERGCLVYAAGVATEILPSCV